MKKTMITAMAFGLVTITSSFAFAASADLGTVLPGLAETAAIQKNWGGEGIVGSSHDLSYDASYTNGATHSGGSAASAAFSTANDAQKRICIYCHHPHNTTAAATLGYSPLWNREMSAKTFAGYTNGLDNSVVDAGASDKRHNLNAADATAGGTAIAGVSLLCMSCHDGVVAMNAYSVSTGSTDGQGSGGTAITSSAGFDNRGGASDMSNHHPMGFDYQAVQTLDAEIAATNTPLVPDGSVRISDVLYGGKMECVTCHDVHNTANQTGAERFLWRTNDHSNFCLTCHLK